MATIAESSSSRHYTEDKSAGVFQCGYCDRVEPNQSTMYYHVHVEHIKDFKYSCAHCEDRKFMQKCAYQQHMANAHPAAAEAEAKAAGEVNPFLSAKFVCFDAGCKHVAKTKGNMEVHYARTHCKESIAAFKKDGENACSGCGKTTFGSSTAYLHHCFKCIVAPQLAAAAASAATAANK